MAVREPTTAARASRLPDLLIIGTAKAGTTALFGALSQHPRVFAPPVKEPLFLAYAGNPPHFAGPAGDRLSHRVISDLPTYQALFDGCPPDAMAFEATPEYLYSRTAPMAALEYVPDARLVAVIRHPVERAFSHYLHLLHEGLETLSFEAAWAAEEERIASGWAPVWHYRARGFYGEQLRRWLDVFPAEQMLVLLYEEWLESPGATLDRICAHARIEPFESFTPRRRTSRRWNRGGAGYITGWSRTTGSGAGPDGGCRSRPAMRSHAGSAHSTCGQARRSIPPFARAWRWPTTTT